MMGETEPRMANSAAYPMSYITRKISPLVAAHERENLLRHTTTRLHPAYFAPLLQLGDEFFGVRPIYHASRFWAEHANRVHIGKDLVGILHSLRIIGGKDDLRGRQLVESKLHPAGASLRGVIRP